MEYPSVINRNKLLIHAAAWMNFMRIMLSERRLLKRLHTLSFYSCDILQKAKPQGEGIDHWLSEPGGEGKELLGVMTMSVS